MTSTISSEKAADATSELAREIVGVIGSDGLADAPFAARNGASEFIARYKHRVVDDPNFSLDLSRACDLVLQALVKQALVDRYEGNGFDRLLQITGMLSFAATETRLSLDSTCLHVMLDLSLPLDDRPPEYLNDVLLILRTVGRQKTTRSDIVFWLGFLDAPDRGIRTVAAQNLIDVDLDIALAGLQDIIEHNVNDGLVAYKILRVAGDVSKLDEAIERSVWSSRNRSLMADLLDKVGEVEAAATLRSSWRQFRHIEGHGVDYRPPGIAAESLTRIQEVEALVEPRFRLRVPDVSNQPEGVLAF